MSPYRNIEHPNSGELRSYPFSDHATLRSQQGPALPFSAVVDAHLLLPPDTEPYLAGITIEDQRFTVSDARTGDLLATGVLDPTTNRVPLQDATYGSRSAGALVLSETRIPDMDLTFAPAAAGFAAACIIPVPESGLSGILVDGQLVTGDPEIIGGTGVRVTADDQTNTIRVDALGYVSLQDDIDVDCVELPPVLRSLLITIAQGSHITGSASDQGILTLAPYKLEQRKICGPSIADMLYAEPEDPCPGWFGIEEAFSFYANPLHGRLRIEADAATTDGTYALRITTDTEPRATSIPRPGPGASMDQIVRWRKRMEELTEGRIGIITIGLRQ